MLKARTPNIVFASGYLLTPERFMGGGEVRQWQPAREPIATHPPLAVFEVLSPEDTIRRMRIKLADYQGKGIPAIFLADPETGVFEQYRDGQLVIETMFHQPERNLSFSLTEMPKLVS